MLLAVLRAGDGASACLLLEAATREVEQALGLGHPGVRAASRRSEGVFTSLSPEERERVRPRYVCGDEANGPQDVVKAQRSSTSCASVSLLSCCLSI